MLVGVLSRYPSHVLVFPKAVSFQDSGTPIAWRKGTISYVSSEAPSPEKDDGEIVDVDEGPETGQEGVVEESEYQTCHAAPVALGAGYIVGADLVYPNLAFDFSGHVLPVSGEYLDVAVRFSDV